MLKLLRDNTKTIIWTVILGFAIWGAGTVAVGRQGQGTVAGLIFGEKVTVTEFNRAGRTLQLLFPPGSGAEIKPEDLDRETWKYLILAYEAKTRGIRISDYEVTDQIQSMFSGGDKFDKDRYKFWIRSVYGDQPRQFEEEIRQRLSVQKLVDSFRPLLDPAEEVVWDWYKKTFLGGKKDSEIEDLEGKKKSFKESVEQWEKTYVSFKDAEAIDPVVEEIEKRADLKSYIPPRIKSETTATSIETAGQARGNTESSTTESGGKQIITLEQPQTAALQENKAESVEMTERKESSDQNVSPAG